MTVTSLIHSASSRQPMMQFDITNQMKDSINVSIKGAIEKYDETNDRYYFELTRQFFVKATSILPSETSKFYFKPAPPERIKDAAGNDTGAISEPWYAAIIVWTENGKHKGSREFFMPIRGAHYIIYDGKMSRKVE